MSVNAALQTCMEEGTHRLRTVDRIDQKPCPSIARHADGAFVGAQGGVLLGALELLEARGTLVDVRDAVGFSRA